MRTTLAMVITPLTLAVAACVTFLLATSLPANSEQALDKAGIEKIVADYIAANGEKLMESIDAAQRREQQAAVDGMIDANTPTRGPKDAPVTIIEFGDFECPFCGRVQPTLAALEKAYGKQVRFAFKQLPLDFHTNAKPAAAAALAAHKQGKYWEYAEKLWANAQNLNDATYLAIAKELKLDMKRFNTDRASDAIKAQIENDLKLAREAGARGTPYFFVNGTPLSGALPEAEFRAVIDAELKAAK